jgi:uncharacterized protein (DUF433 family)
MSLMFMDQPLPLATDEAGAVRVAGTRVTLDTVIAAFQDGLTAEEIAEEYPSLPLAPVYSVIGYFLDHQVEVDAYLAAREQRANEVRLSNEKLFSPVGIRSRLLARQAQRD